jgi:hypothetical protein
MTTAKEKQDRTTVIARIKGAPAFARALYAEAVAPQLQALTGEQRTQLATMLKA